MSQAVASWSPLEGTAHTVAVEILIHGPLSRSVLARRLHLSPATLSRVTKPLLAGGLLVESGPQAVEGLGRPTLPLDVAVDSQHFIGVKLTGDEIHCVLTDLRSRVIASDVTAIGDHDPASVADQMAAAVERLAPNKCSLTSIGVAVSGLVTGGATSQFTGFLGWSGPVPVADLLRERVGLPVVLTNDIVALTQAEAWFGEGRQADSFAMFTTGAGIGFCTATDGRAVTSVDVEAGSAEHIPLDPLGPPCAEGHRGCAAAMLRTSSICATIGIGLGRPVGYHEALRLAKSGDPVAKTVVLASARAYGRLLAMIANLTFVPLIVASGEGVDLAIEWEEIVREEFDLGRSQYAGPVRLLFKRATFRQWARGAAVAAIQTHVLGN